MSATIVLIFTIFWSLFTNLCQQNNASPYVVQITAQNCVHSRRGIVVQTGFLVAKPGENIPPGIVTALHGVVGCRQIYATVQRATGTIITIKDLELGWTDIERDVALFGLTQDQLNIFPSHGLEVLSAPQGEEIAAICVIGYPVNIEAQLVYNSIQVRPTAKENLRSLIPGDHPIEELLGERNSPSLDVEVFSIEGELAKGLSGAPVINQFNQIIGVVDGGLKAAGADTVSWAIPWGDIEWQSNKETIEQIGVLVKSDPQFIFSMQVKSERDLIEVTFGDYIQVIQRARYYIYSSPTENPIGQLDQYTILKVIGGPREVDGKVWWQVRQISKDLEGWVTFFDNDGDSVVLLPSLGPGIRVQVNRFNGLILRDSPDSITTRRSLPNGTQLEILTGPEERPGGLWWYVRMQDGMEGWVIFASIGGIFLELPVDTAPDIHPPVDTATRNVASTLTFTSEIPLTSPLSIAPSAPISSKPIRIHDLLIQINDQLYESSQLNLLHFKVTSNQLLRVEIILQDNVKQSLSSGLATYIWSFNPPDSTNAQRVGNRNNVLIYTAPADRRGQLIMVTIQAPGLYRVIPIQITID